jgi:hypothetical protein
VSGRQAEGQVGMLWGYIGMHWARQSDRWSSRQEEGQLGRKMAAYEGKWPGRQRIR